MRVFESDDVVVSVSLLRESIVYFVDPDQMRSVSQDIAIDALISSHFTRTPKKHTRTRITGTSEHAASEAVPHRVAGSLCSLGIPVYVLMHALRNFDSNMLLPLVL